MPMNANNHSILAGMLDAGALGFKSFMSPAGNNTVFQAKRCPKTFEVLAIPVIPPPPSQLANEDVTNTKAS